MKRLFLPVLFILLLTAAKIGAAPPPREAFDGKLADLTGGLAAERVAAANWFQGLGPDAAGAVQALAESLKSDDPKLVEASAKALGSIGAAASSSIQPLLSALENHPELATMISGSLDRIAPGDPEISRKKGETLLRHVVTLQKQLADLEAILDDPKRLQDLLNTRALAKFQAAEAQSLDTEGLPWKGKEDAKIVVVEFSDFLCPWCKRLSLAFEQFLKQSPLPLKIYHKNYPLEQSCNPNLSRDVHAGSCALALGGICANEQDLFWPYHDKVFALQPKDADVEKVAEIAKDAGLDVATLRSCMDSESAKRKLSSQISEAASLDIHGTPTLFINGKRLENLNNFLQVIQMEAKRLGVQP